MFETILIPTDGSPPAERAAATGLELAAVLDADVHVICVADPGPLGTVRLPGEDASAVDVIRERADEFATRIAERAKTRGIDVTTAVPIGSPKIEIVEYAGENDVDLVVMGTRGSGGLERIALGSVADHVIRFADCEVLVSRGRR